MIYLDNAATTPVYNEIIEAMMPYFKDCYGNPSAVYGLAGSSARGVKIARDNIAKLISAKPEEIFFTSGGTESDNWALKSVVEMLGAKGKHIISSKIEHKAILQTCKWLEQNGIDVTYLDVDSDGLVNPDDVSKAIRPDTVLISVMLANNEIGTIEPIAEIGKIAHERGILMHTDAVQAFGHIPINVDELNIDMLSASAHKINGPKGVGVLYVRHNMRLPAFMHGGSQERKRRAGTLNVPGIVGMGEAARIAATNIETDIDYITELRDHLIMRVLDEIPDVYLSGHRINRLPNNAHFCFDRIDGEALVLLLDSKGVCASGGAACTTGDPELSHVLVALGRDQRLAKGALRLTLSRDNTIHEVDEAIDQLKWAINSLRQRMI